MRTPLLTGRGGDGEPIVLVHGLMGRGTTWSRQLPWLTAFGEVYTYDAPWHRGRDVADPHPISTERFVDDLADAVAELGRPATLIGHSMGGLHSWCLAAARPDLVTAVVVEDMAPDFRGRTTGPVGAVAARAPGRIRVRAAGFRRVRARRRAVLPRGVRPDGDRLAAARAPGAVDRDRRAVGHPGLLAAVAAVRAPALLIEAGNSVTPPGQMRQMDESGSPGNVFAGAWGRSSGPRRRARGIPRTRSRRSYRRSPSRLTRPGRAAARSACGRRRRRARCGSSRDRPRASSSRLAAQRRRGGRPSSAAAATANGAAG